MEVTVHTAEGKTFNFNDTKDIQFKNDGSALRIIRESDENINFYIGGKDVKIDSDKNRGTIFTIKEKN